MNIRETMHQKVHGFLQMQAYNHMLLYEHKQIVAKTMHLEVYGSLLFWLF